MFFSAYRPYDITMIYWRYFMIYLTGDTHGDFQRIAHFCARMHTKPTDVIIILGDAGINFSGGWRDLHKKEFISQLPITLFCIHGNHEQRPARIPSYTEQEWHGGTVYVEEQFPSILFAKSTPPKPAPTWARRMTRSTPAATFRRTSTSSTRMFRSSSSRSAKRLSKLVNKPLSRTMN